VIYSHFLFRPQAVGPGTNAERDQCAGSKTLSVQVKGSHIEYIRDTIVGGSFTVCNLAYYHKPIRLGLEVLAASDESVYSSDNIVFIISEYTL